VGSRLGLLGTLEIGRRYLRFVIRLSSRIGVCKGLAVRQLSGLLSRLRR